MGKRLIIIKILVYIVLAYILIFNIGTLLETHMIHKEYMASLYDFDYKPSIQHTQFWCKTNIFIIIMIALFFVIFQTKRSRVWTVCLFADVVFLLLHNYKSVVEICNLIEIVDEWRLVNMIAGIIVAILLGILTVKDNAYNKK